MAEQVIWQPMVPLKDYEALRTELNQKTLAYDGLKSMFDNNSRERDGLAKENVILAKERDFESSRKFDLIHDLHKANRKLAEAGESCRNLIADNEKLRREHEMDKRACMEAVVATNNMADRLAGSEAAYLEKSAEVGELKRKIDEIESTLEDEESSGEETMAMLIRTKRENGRLRRLVDCDPAEIKMTAEEVEQRLGTKHWAVYVLAESLANTFKDGGTKNLVMSGVTTIDGFKMVVTVQKEGGKSPVELLEKYKNSHDKILEAAKLTYATLASPRPNVPVWVEKEEALSALFAATKEAEKLNAEGKAEAA